MLVGGRVDEQAGRGQEHLLEQVGHGQEEEHLDVVGGLEGRDDGLGGAAVEAQGGCELGQLVVIAHVLGHAAVVAAGDDEAHSLPGLGAQPGVGPDGQGHVLFALEPVDAEQEPLAAPQGLTALDLGALLGVGVDARVDGLEVSVLGQGRPGSADDALGEVGIDGDGVGKAHAPLLEPVKGDAVGALPPLLAALGEQQVGEVAVEEDAAARVEVLEQREAGAELVDEEGIGRELPELPVEVNLDDQVQLAQDGAEDAEAGQDRGRDDGVAADSDVEGFWNENNASQSRCAPCCCCQLKKGNVPSRASSKQWLRSRWLVKTTTLCPRFCMPTAASTTRRSAPPMPRSGCKKTIVLPEGAFFSAMVVVQFYLAIKEEEMLGSGQKQAPDFWE